MVELYYYILTFFWALFVSLFAIPSIIAVAHKKQLLDIPNQRRLHLSSTPRLGGLAIFAGFFSAVLTFGDIDSNTQKMLAGSIIIFFIGLKDDMVSISAFKKFFVQFLSASIVLFLSQNRITNFYGILGIGPLDEGLSYFITFIVILGITNAVNLIDGVDGLAGSLLSVALIVYAFIGIALGGEESRPVVYICVGLLGALIGFLRYNIRNAIIFMGDTGSLVSGFIISFVAIHMSNIPVPLEWQGALPVISVTAIILPVSDTVRVFLLRIFKGDSPFTADRNHFHHRLLDLGFSSLQVVFTLVGLTLFTLAFLLILLEYYSPTTSFGALVVLLMIWYTLFEKYFYARIKK